MNFKNWLEQQTGYTPIMSALIKIRDSEDPVFTDDPACGWTDRGVLCRRLKLNDEETKEVWSFIKPVPTDRQMEDRPTWGFDRKVFQYFCRHYMIPIR